jgi:TrmH RNA methyltransferase
LTATTTTAQPARVRAPHPKSLNAPEHKVAGQNACRALFRARPQDIRRVYVTEKTLPLFKDVLKMCAVQRVAYHVKTDADLDAVAETVHHDGVLFLARAKAEASVDDVVEFADRLASADRMALVLLENVKNPHNLGAILRVCAHFGVPFCLRAGATPPLSPAVLRTAEGGAEHTDVVDAGDGVALLEALQGRGFALLATSSHATLALGGAALPRKSVVLFGSEGEGLSPALTRLADDVVAIPGSGALESLNVACASSILLWELWKGSPPVPLPGRSGPGSEVVVPSREAPRVAPTKKPAPARPRARSGGRGRV